MAGWADTRGGHLSVSASSLMAEVARLEEAHNDGHPFPDAST